METYFRRFHCHAESCEDMELLMPASDDGPDHCPRCGDSDTIYLFAEDPYGLVEVRTLSTEARQQFDREAES